MKIFVAVALLLLAGCAAKGPAGDGPAVSPAQASIPFTEFGSIRDWRADGSAGIYIESDDRHWYHATFMSPCTDLPYTEHVGFRTTPPLPLDKFDSITIRGQNCFFKSLEKTAGPPGKAAQ